MGALAVDMGFTQVSLSSSLMPMVKLVPRGYTAAADAYLTPHILAYVQRFKAGFEHGLEPPPPGAAAAAAAPSPPPSLLFMQSDGGLASAACFSGHRAVLSGPAAGVVGPVSGVPADTAGASKAPPSPPAPAPPPPEAPERPRSAGDAGAPLLLLPAALTTAPE